MALFNSDRGEGSQTGPRPGQGATIANPAAGNEDMEGTPPNALPNQRGRARSDTTAAPAGSTWTWLVVALVLVVGLAATMWMMSH